MENQQNCDYNFTKQTGDPHVRPQKKPIMQFLDCSDHQPRIASDKCKACKSRMVAYAENSKAQNLQGVNINSSLIAAKFLLNSKNYIEAEKLLETLLKLNIEHSDVFYILGECKRLQSKLKEAEYFLLRAL